MPFSTDNSWPAGLLKIFEICREVNRPLENRYYGPYDKLINYCFGDSFTFFVAPQHPPDNATKEAIDFIVFLIVFDALRRPVLIAEVKDDSRASNPGLRLLGDRTKDAGIGRRRVSEFIKGVEDAHMPYCV